MIYTVTFNPAIDYLVFMDQLKIGATNRTASEEYFYGGKGINVSTILSTLGVENTALGFVSGWTGKALVEGLQEKGIRTDFIELDPAGGITRVNVKIKGETDPATGRREETEINGQGPHITEEAVESLFGIIDALTADDILVISGSVPKTMPEDTYEQILARLSVAREGAAAGSDGTRLPVVVDATGDLLLKVLPYHPFLIKPNNDELGEMLGRETQTTEEIIEGAKELRARGARNVIISRGAKGAVLVSEQGDIIVQDPIPGNTVNSVGAGDSMVAGFLAGYIKAQDYQYAMLLGTAAGSATACSPGLATREEIERRMSE